MRFTHHTNGRSSEHAAMLAISKHVALLNIPRIGAKQIGKDRLIRQKVACDICGTIKGSGRSFVTDVKHCDAKARFTFSTYAKQHQIDELIAQGAAGAVAGLLVESSAIKAWFWIPWHCLKETGIDWMDDRNIIIGPTTHLPKIELILHREEAHAAV